ncbi:protein OSB1, mitochondrial isoform X2 [Prunus persica]|uniref:protein OSB1, mitochondrial isoform X2 n=1 Tax=Prunus persica TaxID=3760 RepID=UPI0009AB55DD|nr:protein OSB1, mitochondrial isoform X2 [Prunus persica]
MKALHLLTQFRKPSPSLLFSQRLALLSSSSAANPRVSNSFSDDDREGSGVYRRALKFQRPTTITWRRREESLGNSDSFIGTVWHPWQENLGNSTSFIGTVWHPWQENLGNSASFIGTVWHPWQENLGNSASFIGTVIHPLRVVNNNDRGPFGVHTVLCVKNSPQSDSNFRLFRFLHKGGSEWGFQTASPVVQELNYVAQHGQGSSSKTYEEPQSDGGGAVSEKYKDRLHLWQVFFANPYEWWDNREDKLNPRQPDFKHKDTGEALWLSPGDPPWIKRQLELLDTRMAQQGHGQKRFRVSKWEYDE